LEEVIISALFSPSFHWLLGGDINADWMKADDSALRRRITDKATFHHWARHQ